MTYPAKTYRLRRYYFNIGVGWGSFFLLLAIVSPFGAKNAIGALFFASFWSFWVLLSAWIVAAYYRGELRLEPLTIISHGVLRVKTIEHCEVRLIRWSNYNISGNLAVKTLSEQIKIALDNFTAEEQTEIINYFRINFAEELQENWPEFSATLERQKAPPSPASRRVVRFYAGILAFFTLASLIAWLYGLGPQFLAVAIINVIVGLWIFWWKRSTKAGTQKGING